MAEFNELNEQIQDLLTQIKKIDLTPVFGRDFKNEDVYLDGREFVDCNFNNCRLFCYIGHWRVLGKYNVKDCEFRFEYPAGVVWDTVRKLDSQQHDS
jgi:hypothetical protein